MPLCRAGMTELDLNSLHAMSSVKVLATQGDRLNLGGQMDNGPLVGWPAERIQHIH